MILMSLAAYCYRKVLPCVLMCIEDAFSEFPEVVHYPWFV